MTDKSIPVYWQEYLDGKIRTINTLQEEAGDGSFSFVVITDMHYPINAGVSPLLIKRIAEETGVNYALCLGDVQTSWCHDTVDEVYAENELIDALLEPVRDRLLITEGNHDGCYGWLDRDGNG